MYNRGLFIKGLLVVSVIGMLCGFAWAAQQSGQTDPNKPAQGDQATSPGATGLTTMRPGAGTAGQMAQQPTQIAKTSDLIGKKLKNAQSNDDLGTIHDLVLTPDFQQVSYAALSHGGTLGIGSKLFAIPWSAIKVAPDGMATASITKQALDQANSFDDNNWPNQGDSRWQGASTMGAGMSTSGQTTTSPSDQSAAGTAGTSSTGPSAQATRPRSSTSSTDASQDPNRAMTRGSGRSTTVQRDEYNQMAGTAGSTARSDNANVQNRRVSKLTGMSVRNPQNEDIGDIEDFVIDAPNGHLVYTIVSFGGFWGIGEKYAAVPSAAIGLQPQQGIAMLNADRQALESVAFDSGKWPDLMNREYAQRLHEVFKEMPYQATLGYVAPNQQQSAANSQQAWSAQGDYAKHFDPNQITTIKGTVQSVGTFEPAKGVAEGLRLRLKTSDGSTVTVHAGPAWYAQQQNFTLRPGDNITVTGSKTKMGWRSVFVASEIQKGSDTLRLRSKTGEPLWSRQAGQQRQTSPPSTATPGMSSQGQTGQSGSSSSSGQRRDRTRQ